MQRLKVIVLVVAVVFTLSQGSNAFDFKLPSAKDLKELPSQIGINTGGES